MRHTLKALIACLPLLAAAETATGLSEHAKNERPPTIREERPFNVNLSAGDPSPAVIGLRVNYSLHRHLQLSGGAGFLSFSDLRIISVSGGVRVPILRSQVTPIVGGGVNVMLFSGRGNFRSLDSSLFLGNLMIGVDWTARYGFHLTMGWNFQFPTEVGTPFVNVGYAF